MTYRPSEIEPRWQQFWDENNTFIAVEEYSRPKYYCLDMFPYPSGSGLHVGHPSGYVVSDVVCRYKRSLGFNVLHPMGWDAFGLPAEQRAINEGVDPRVSTAEATTNFRRQLKSLGFSYDWSREISTADPSYYRWTQYVFTLMYNQGLVYEADTEVNWCEALGTVLANDEVVGGRSERGDHPVTIRVQRQWMLRTTRYAESLMTGLESLDWPGSTVTIQQNWVQGADDRKFRDQIFARQRYWGEPIPVLKDGGKVVRVLEPSELPLTLPVITDYKPRGKSPLAAADSWVNVKDPITGRNLQRETDTMPGSAGSSWYFLRFCDPHNQEEICSREKSDYWMPVDLYVGGPEHAVGHLLYSRMWYRFLHEQGIVRDSEPFLKLRHQGMILGETFYDSTGRIVPSENALKSGTSWTHSVTGEPLTVRIEKMTKRSSNSVSPDEVVGDYGADALRVYLCFMGPVDVDKPWQTRGLESQFKWLQRVWKLFFDESDNPRVKDQASSEKELQIVHKAIKKVTEDIESLGLNTAISALHVATRDLLELKTVSRDVLEPLAQLMSPFAPHFAEEVWARGLGHENGISFVPWPSHDPRFTESDDPHDPQQRTRTGHR